MKIKRIKYDNLPNCRYCKMENLKSPSVWHLTQECIQSCDRHKIMLERIRDKANKEQRHYTEADYQTWMRV